MCHCMIATDELTTFILPQTPSDSHPDPRPLHGNGSSADATCNSIYIRRLSDVDASRAPEFKA